MSHLLSGLKIAVQRSHRVYGHGIVLRPFSFFSGKWHVVTTIPLEAGGSMSFSGKRRSQDALRVSAFF